MFDRFSDSARKVMGLSKAEAQRLDHEYIGTEHILLGIAGVRDCAAARILATFGIDLGRIRAEIERLVRGSPTMVTQGNIPFTPRAKRVLELAVEEATNLGHRELATGHLLLGLIGEGQGIAARVLRNLGVELAAARERVREQPRDDPARPLPAPEAPAPPRLLPRFDRFTDRARRVMGLAKSAANELNHEYIGTEHVLLGLAQEGTGVAAKVLKNFNVEVARIRADLAKIVVQDGPKAAPHGNLPFTPRAKRVLELADDESSDFGHNYIGTEHLLLGLIREGEGIAARVLMNLGLDLGALRDEVRAILGVEQARPRLDVETPSRPPVESDPAGIPPFTVRRSTLRIGIASMDRGVLITHLRAYQRWGQSVAAVADEHDKLTDQAARLYRVGTSLSNFDELLAHPDVDVIDVAVPWILRRDLLAKLLRAGKPVLLQKPLAGSFDDARRIVEEFEGAKVPLAVNQSLRASPEMVAARHLISGGHLGTVFDMRWTMRNTFDRRGWANESWRRNEKRVQFLSWSEHHLDAFRFLLDDEAARVYCALPRRPDQNLAGDVCATSVIHFRNGAHVSMVDSNASTPGRPETQELDIDGTAGSVSLGLGATSRFEYWLAKEIVGDTDAPAHRPPLPGAWFPDGFAGSMAAFLEAVERGVEPPTSGRRNLGTMALVDACYRSAEIGQAVDVPLVD